MLRGTNTAQQLPSRAGQQKSRGYVENYIISIFFVRCINNGESKINSWDNFWDIILVRGFRVMVGGGLMGC